MSTSSSTLTSSSVPRLSGSRVIAGHQPQQALHAVVDVHEGAGLLAVAPDFDLAAVRGQRDLAGDGGRRLFLAAVVGAQRAVDVVEAHDAGLEAVIVAVVTAQFLGEELLPAIAGLGIGRIGVLFLQGRDVGVILLVLRVDAGRGGEQETLHAVDCALASSMWVLIRMLLREMSASLAVM